MTIGQRTRLTRGLMSVIQPLTGTRATGHVLAHATSAPVSVARNSYAVPVVLSAAGTPMAAYERLVKTADDVEVTAAGTQVPVMSTLGGANVNLPAGTKLVWDPPIEGLEARSDVVAPGLTGGVEATGLGVVKRVATYEGLGAADAAAALFRAGLGAFPAVVIAREGASDGGTKGRDVEMRLHRFRFYVVCERLDGDDPRRHEGEAILDYLEAMLARRSAVDGENISSPSIQLGEQGRFAIASSSYIHFLDVLVSAAVKRKELREFPPWLRTDLVMQIGQPPFNIVDHAQWVQLQSFSDGFSNAFGRVARNDEIHG